MALLVMSATPASGQAIMWDQRFSSSDTTQALAVSASSSGIYVGGATTGVFPGETKTVGGYTDAFVRKYDAGGAVVWTRQFGGGAGDPGMAAFTVALGTSATADGVYVVGKTPGVLPGDVSSGGEDAFLRKYDPSGNLLWSRQFGIPEFASNEVAFGVSATSDGIYVVGRTGGTAPGGDPSFTDAFIRKYDATGSILWTRQFGAPAPDCPPAESCPDTIDEARAVSASPDGVYVAGYTEGVFPGESYAGTGDAFLRKYDTSGDVLWTRQFGTTEYESALGVSASGDVVYVGGETTGTFPGHDANGSFDAFVRKYSATGDASWTEQFGTTAKDGVMALSATSTAVYVAGEGEGIIDDFSEGFVRKYDRIGSPIWTRELYERPYAVSAPPEGIYVAGRWGEGQAFVARIGGNRPDGQISRSSSTGFVGDGIYNKTGIGQTKTAKAQRGTRSVFYVRAENDGHVTDRLSIEGCRSSSGFRVRYFAGATGSTEVTNTVLAGNYALKVTPGSWKTFRLVIGIQQSAELRKIKACKITVTSNTTMDVVLGRARVV